MSRQALNSEFFQKLKKLTGHKTHKAFADACGKGSQQANVVNYLNGQTNQATKS